MPPTRGVGGRKREGEGERVRERERERERCADAWFYSLGGYIRPDVEFRGSVRARRPRR